MQKGEVLQQALKRKTDVIGVMGMLLDRGAPLNAVEYQNHPESFSAYWNIVERGTPLFKAVAMGNAEAVRFLLELGADASIRSSDGRTALECGEKEGFTEVINILNRTCRE